jgi:hypothetical protein
MVWRFVSNSPDVMSYDLYWFSYYLQIVVVDISLQFHKYETMTFCNRPLHGVQVGRLTLKHVCFVLQPQSNSDWGYTKWQLLCSSWGTFLCQRPVVPQSISIGTWICNGAAFSTHAAWYSTCSLHITLPESSPTIFCFMKLFCTPALYLKGCFSLNSHNQMCIL